VLEAMRADGFRGVVVVDAALMLDWQLERRCDAVLAVVADERDQVARLVSARGWSESQARARLAAQRTNEAFAAAADVALNNRGSTDELAKAARDAVQRLQGRERA
jgi:dephospho-CoA kinase